MDPLDKRLESGVLQAEVPINSNTRVYLAAEVKKGPINTSSITPLVSVERNIGDHYTVGARAAPTEKICEVSVGKNVTENTRLNLGVQVTPKGSGSNVTHI